MQDAPTTTDDASGRAAGVARELHPTRLLLAVGIGAALYALTGLLPLGGEVEPHRARMAAAVTGVVATAWLTGAMPLGAASLLPLPLFSLLGVMPLSVQGPGYGAATSYAHPVLWLFFGGFILALGIERWGLHRRIALRIVTRFGVRPGPLVLAFMVASAFLSMWLSNTSVTLMLLPIGVALVEGMADGGAFDEAGKRNFGFTLLLGIAYGASIGGLATPIGTPPNALYLSAWAQLERAGAPPMTFLGWMLVVLPLVLVFLPLVWWLLTAVLAPVGSVHPEAGRMLEAQAGALPPMDRAEKSMLALFAGAAVLWSTREDLVLGSLGTVPGWWRLLPVPAGSWVGDGAVAVAVALLAFVLPSGRRPGQALMDWEHARKLPWDILLLLGGGIAIAEAFRHSGLGVAVGAALEPALGSLPPLGAVVLLCTAITFLTEITSNTAIASLLMPILLAASSAAKIDPRLLMLPATLSASAAFMLPIATPPNALVFASGWIPITRMARVGLVINLVGVVLITALMWTVGVPLLGIDLSGPPAWLPPSGP